MSTILNVVENATDFPESAIRGIDGAPIVCGRVEGSAHLVCTLAEQYLGYKLESEYTDKHGPTDDFCLVPRGSKPQRKLSAPEIAVLQAFCWLSDTYFFPIKRDTPMTFPEIIWHFDDKYIDDNARLGFVDEGRAYMFASIIENTYCFDAEVVEGPHGWVVTVDGHNSPTRVFSMEDVLQLRGICQLLDEYTVTPAPKAIANLLPSEERFPNPAAREAWRSRKTAQADRIETALNEILSRLHSASDADAAKLTAKAASLVESIEEHHQDSHKDAHVRTKSSGKSKASA